MSRTVEGETEILLGNKHLLGIFFLLAVLFGVSFVAGYMLGHGSFDKRTAAETAATSASSGAAQTRAVDPTGAEPTPPPSTATVPASDQPLADKATGDKPVDNKPAAKAKPEANAAIDENSPLGKKATAAKASDAFAPLPADDAATAKHAVAPPVTVHRSNELYTPDPGQRFLQVAAENRASAENVAAVLNQSGLETHIVAKPGDDNLFRVLVGPIKDNNDLTAKREALTRKGFTKVIPRSF